MSNTVMLPNPRLALTQAAMITGSRSRPRRWAQRRGEPVPAKLPMMGKGRRPS